MHWLVLISHNFFLTGVKLYHEMNYTMKGIKLLRLVKPMYRQGTTNIRKPHRLLVDQTESLISFKYVQIWYISVFVVTGV